MRQPAIIYKKCTKCSKALSLDHFPPSKTRGYKDGRTYWCKYCLKNYQKEYRQREDARQKGLIRSRRWQRKIRREAMEKLCNGEPYCAVCGFKGDLRLLQFDHVYNDGNDERKAHNSKNSYMIYKNISTMPVKEAKRKYQVLCVAHNWLKRYGDIGTEYALVLVNA